MSETLHDRSLRAHNMASEAAAGRENWNVEYVDALRAIGFDLHSIKRDVRVGPDGPIMAPLPAPSGWQYPYPCVVAPKGWKP